jgi:hypothetical protein
VLKLEIYLKMFAQKIDFHYIEVAHSLCKHAREDMTDWNQIYDLVVCQSI